MFDPGRTWSTSRGSGELGREVLRQGHPHARGTPGAPALARTAGGLQPRRAPAGPRTGFPHRAAGDPRRRWVRTFPVLHSGDVRRGRGDGPRAGADFGALTRSRVPSRPHGRGEQGCHGSSSCQEQMHHHAAHGRRIGGELGPHAMRAPWLPRAEDARCSRDCHGRQARRPGGPGPRRRTCCTRGRRRSW
ncbi:hypothetical protein QJS66_03090 [Kocuria rhizophila]|nr:hypothetical protein QJS66_03090 [Kocuria rhizophila]